MVGPKITDTDFGISIPIEDAKMLHRSPFEGGAPHCYARSKDGVALMGTRADHDLWSQVIAIENRYGDRAPEVLNQRISRLRDAGELREAAFWSEVAMCIKDLHSIRFDIPAAKARAGGKSHVIGERTRSPIRDVRARQP